MSDRYHVVYQAARIDPRNANRTRRAWIVRDSMNEERDRVYFTKGRADTMCDHLNGTGLAARMYGSQPLERTQ